jgi:hypothetical protein
MIPRTGQLAGQFGLAQGLIPTIVLQISSLLPQRSWHLPLRRHSARLAEAPEGPSRQMQAHLRRALHPVRLPAPVPPQPLRESLALAGRPQPQQVLPQQVLRPWKQPRRARSQSVLAQVMLQQVPPQPALD